MIYIIGPQKHENVRLKQVTPFALVVRPIQEESRPNGTP
jgi:hypothetical protein